MSEPTEDESAMTLAVNSLDVPPGKTDFVAMAQVLAAVPRCVLTFQSLGPGAPEFRDPLDTHVQLLPFPLGELDAPLLPTLQRLRAGGAALPGRIPTFAFKHSLQDLGTAKVSEGDLAAHLASGLEAAFTKASGELGDLNGGFDLLVCREWLLLAPLRVPGAEEVGHWKTLPPCPPIGLLGLLLLPEVEAAFPETTGASWGTSGP